MKTTAIGQHLSLHAVSAREFPPIVAPTFVERLGLDSASTEKLSTVKPLTPRNYVG